MEHMLDLVAKTILTERPLIMQKYADYLDSLCCVDEDIALGPIRFLEQFLLTAGLQLCHHKPTLMRVHEPRVCFLIESFEPKDRIDFIHSHMAIFNVADIVKKNDTDPLLPFYNLHLDESSNELYLGRVPVSRACCSTFRPFRDEPFLRLMLSGICEEKFIFYSQANTDVCLRECLSPRRRINPKPVARKEAARLDGHGFELIAQLSLTQATRVGGLTGTPFPQFLRGFLRNFVALTIQDVVLDPGLTCAQFVVPFAGVIDGVWPPELIDAGRSCGIEFLHARIPKDTEKFDFSLERDQGDVLLAMEAKNHKRPVDDKLLAQILAKLTANHTPQFLFVFANAFTLTFSPQKVIGKLSKVEAARLADYTWTRLVPADDTLKSYRLCCLTPAGSKKTIVLFSLEKTGIVIAT